MKSLRTAIEVLTSLTDLMKYPVVLLDEQDNIQWFNPLAETRFDKKNTVIATYVQTLDSEQMHQMTIMGECYATDSITEGERVYFFEIPYNTEGILFATFVPQEHIPAWEENFRRYAEGLVISSMGRQSLMHALLAVENIERQAAANKLAEHEKDFNTIQRELYTLYRLTNDYALARMSREPIPAEIYKFEYIDYLKEMMFSIKMICKSLKVDFSYTTALSGQRYLIANPEHFVYTVTKLARSMAVFSTDKAVKATLLETKRDQAVIRFVAKSRQLLDYLVDTSPDRSVMGVMSHRAEWVQGVAYVGALQFAAANHMAVTQTPVGEDELQIDLTFYSTPDGFGALNTPLKSFLGDRFSAVTVELGDLF